DIGFERDWRELLSAAPDASFALDPAYLAWEARHGAGAVAAMFQDGAHRGLAVLRETLRGMVSGWPWRWQALVAHPGRGAAEPLTLEECDWLFERIGRLAGGRRLMCFMPGESGQAATDYAAGATCLTAIDRPEA